MQGNLNPSNPHPHPHKTQISYSTIHMKSQETVNNSQDSEHGNPLLHIAIKSSYQATDTLNKFKFICKVIQVSPTHTPIPIQSRYLIVHSNDISRNDQGLPRFWTWKRVATHYKKIFILSHRYTIQIQSWVVPLLWLAPLQARTAEVPAEQTSKRAANIWEK